MTFADELAAWLPSQRWFAGKGTSITRLTITADNVLIDADPGLPVSFSRAPRCGG